MARLNLLPWREAQRKERNQQFGVMMGAVAFAALAVMGAVHLYFEALIGHQKARNDFLTQEISVLDQRIKEIQDIETKKQSLLARMNIIQELQSRRPVVVHLFDELVKTIPEGVVLDSLVQKGDDITIKGIAQSNERISTYMRALDKSEWLGVPKLTVISARGAGEAGAVAAQNFTLEVKQTWKDKDKEDEQ